ncbi:UNVERIFIED_CONTAM: Ddo [Trichonephila clavipes]
MVFKVAVIGGGVMGITSAVVITENLPDVEVTVISDKWSPDTTGDGSAGFWCPYLLGDVPTEVLREWCQISFQTFHDIYKSPLAVEYGVGLFSVYYLYSAPEVGDNTFYLFFHSNFEREYPGGGQEGLPPLFPFHQPHERICGLTAILSTPMLQRHSSFCKHPCLFLCEFDPRPNDTVVSVTNHYTEYAERKTNKDDIFFYK